MASMADSLCGEGDSERDMLSAAADCEREDTIEDGMRPSEVNERTLDQAVLALLGEEKTEEQKVGPNLQKDLAVRWTNVLKNGLNDEVLNNLNKLYPPAENCPHLEASKLNPEVASAINEQVAKRDNKLAMLQMQIGAALSSLGQLLTAFLTEEGGGNQNYIKLASDASRLLLDFHHKQSITRRDLIAINLRKDLKDTFTSVPGDGWLFGNNLGERVKAVRNLEKVCADLKPTKPSSFKKKIQVPRDNLNYRRPPRQPQQGVSQGGRTQKNRTPFHRGRGNLKREPSPERRRPRSEPQRPREKFNRL